MKVALLHDFIGEYTGGAEVILPEFIKFFYPHVDIFFGFTVKSKNSKEYLKSLKEQFPECKINSGPIIPNNKFLFKATQYLFPYFYSGINLQKYDLVFISTAFLAHTIIPSTSGNVIVYMHTPSRMLWNLPTSNSFIKRVVSPTLLKIVQEPLRNIDVLSLQNTSQIISNSKEVQKRIFSFYNKTSDVVYPPVTLPKYDNILPLPKSFLKRHPRYMVHISRLEEYKNITLLIKTVAEYKLPQSIFILGTGNEKKALIKYAEEMLNDFAQEYGNEISQKPWIRVKNIYFTDFVPENTKYAFLKNAACSFALNNEDFGITKIESFAMGTPVVALNAGGNKELVIEKENGVFFNNLTTKSLFIAIQDIASIQFEKQKIIEYAQQFTPDKFVNNLQDVLKNGCVF